MAGETDFSVWMRYDGAWHDITSDVDLSSPVTTKVGQPDEFGSPVATEITLTLEDESAKYNPDNPESPLYGKIGLNTPIAVCEGPADVAGWLYQTEPDDLPSGFYTSHSTALGVTGDFDARFDANPATNWLGNYYMVGKGSALDKIAWAFYMAGTGKPALMWTEDGTTAKFAVSAAAMPTTSGRQAVRVTMDVNNGAAGKTVTFYTAPTNAGPWTLLSTVTTAGTTSVYNATGQGVSVGTISSVDPAAAFSGQVYAFEFRSSIGGTVVADPSFTSRANMGKYGFADTSGNAWSPVLHCLIRDESTRAVANAVSWTPLWDSSGYRKRVAVSARGVLARLGRSSRVDGYETIRRYLSTSTGTAAYWPLTDGTGASAPASVAPANPAYEAPGPLTVNRGSAATEYLPGTADFGASEKIARIGDMRWRGDIPAYSSPFGTTSAVVGISFPDTWDAADPYVPVFTAVGRYSTGKYLTAHLLLYRPVGTAYLWVYDPFTGSDYQLVALGSWSTLVGKDVVAQIKFSNLTASTGRITVDIYEQYGSLLLTAFADIGSYINANIREVYIGPGDNNSGSDTTQLGFGHLVVNVSSGSGDLATHLVSSVSFGYPLEQTNVRARRLLGEAQEAYYIAGPTTECPPMAAQQKGDTLALLDTVASTEAGLLLEDHKTGVITLRTRESRRALDPVLTLSSTNGTMAYPVSRPTDLSKVMNEVTAKQSAGSSATYRKTTGTRNAQDPEDDPQGIGLYPGSVTVDISDGSYLSSYASFHTLANTIGASRISSVTVELEHNPSLVSSVRSLTPGDWLRINFPNLVGGRGSFDYIVYGWSESLGVKTRTITFNVAPADGWKNVVLDTKGRMQTNGHELSASLSSSATTFSARRTGSVNWITNASHASLFPFDIEIGGEVMTVSAIGAAYVNTGVTYQDFTVTRSVNYITKSHVAGEVIRVSGNTRLGL